jgi:hypothetical protein
MELEIISESARRDCARAQNFDLTVLKQAQPLLSIDVGEGVRRLILQTGRSFSFDTARRNPEHPRRREGINSPSLPPGDFVSDAMEVPVMDSAQRYGELVAHLARHRAGLGEPQMVGVCGASSTDQTGLRGNELEVGFVAESTGLANHKYTFVDLPGRVIVNVYRSRRELVIGRL